MSEKSENEVPSEGIITHWSSASVADIQKGRPMIYYWVKAEEHLNALSALRASWEKEKGELERWVGELQNKLLIEAGRWSNENLEKQALEDMVKVAEAREYQLRDNSERAYADAKRINPDYDWEGQTQTAQIAVWGVESLVNRLKAKVSELEDAIETAETQHGLETEATNYIFKRCDELRAANDTLTCALAEAREVLEKSRDLHYSVYVPNESEAGTDYRRKKAYEGYKLCLDAVLNPTSQRASEEMKGLRKVALACHKWGKSPANTPDKADKELADAVVEFRQSGAFKALEAYERGKV